MRAIEIHEYGAPGVLHLSTSFAEPAAGPGQVLVAARATSVNPIDCRMRGGYGRALFSKMRPSEFPMVLGRDVAGEVVAVGDGVTRFAVGDRVFGAPNTGLQGTYAEKIAVAEGELALIPDGLDDVGAAALAYVGATVWAALAVHAGLTRENAAGQRVLIVAGAGGTGSFTVQWMKAWGCHVGTVASAKNEEYVRGLGADEIVNYETADFADVYRDYDVVFDNLGTDEDRAVATLKQDGTARFVTIVHPFLSTLDDLGLEKGMPAANEEQTGRKERFSKLANYAWSVAQPTAEGMEEFARLASAGQLEPQITATYPLEQAREAHERVEAGHVPGKIVLTVDA